MKNINFLPERYHERDLKRKAAIWQYAILAGFGGLLLAATFGQLAMKRSLQASLRELEPTRIEAKVKRERVQLLQQQLNSTEEVAALYTYLRHPWPRTQLLAKITEVLPECIVLDGIEILEQLPNRSSFVGNEAGEGASEASPAGADLAQLRDQHDATSLVVRIRGTVDDTGALNEYVRQLGEVPLFRSVSLSSLQSQMSRNETPRSAFELNVVVRPGHGQPGGPSEPLARRDQVARISLERPAQ
ncbi:MAG TPA: PilN domain-containing protein [Pirellulaceae bacterium]|nr:PilN domain-containing protein [Pirellulaceae bacterium]